MTSSVDSKRYTNQMGQGKRAIGGSTRGMDMVWNKPQRGRGSLSFGRMVFFLNNVKYTILCCSHFISHYIHDLLELNFTCFTQ